MNISIISAMDINNLIGKNKTIPWLIKDDLQYFKYITLGKAVIMGRLTYQSIGKHLKNRKNIVLTKNKYFYAKNCLIVNSIKEAIKNIFPYKSCFIIGGSDIYKIFYKYSNYLYITEVTKEFKGNVYFPYINMNNWILLKQIYRKKHIYKIYKRNNLNNIL